MLRSQAPQYSGGGGARGSGRRTVWTPLSLFLCLEAPRRHDRRVKVGPIARSRTSEDPEPPADYWTGWG